MTRTEAAQRFAEVMGWRWSEEDQEFATDEQFGPWYIDLPAPDAPLHEQLQFVGRIAEAVGLANVRADWNRCTSPALRAVVTFNYSFEAEAPDLSWAAMLAAAEAKGSAR